MTKVKLKDVEINADRSSLEASDRQAGLPLNPLLAREEEGEGTVYVQTSVPVPVTAGTTLGICWDTTQGKTVGHGLDFC